jgi:SET domain
MGLFALQPIAAGERVIEYKGELTSWRHAAVPQRSKAGRTFVFGLSDGRVVDGSRGGNSARFLNHACAPNCEAIGTGDRYSFMRSPLSQPAISSLSTTVCQSTVRSPTTFVSGTRVIAARQHVAEPCWATMPSQRRPAAVQRIQ